MSPGAPPPARPPDRLANPTLVVAIGQLGSEVATLLEGRAAELSEVLGEVAVRNLATLRVMQLETLKQVVVRGLQPGLEHSRVVWFDPAWGEGSRKGVRGPDYTDAFTEREDQREGHRQAFIGWDPLTTTGYSASGVLRQQLREMIAVLFRVDSFVDYHPDRDSYPSRLDIYVVGDVTDPLSEATHCAIQSAITHLVSGPLAPLFREHYSNLAITHMLAFPIVDHDEVRARFEGAERTPMEAARQLVSRYRLEGQKLFSEDGVGQGRILSSRFLFMEDRSFRYVVTREQLCASLAEYLTLMSMRRTGEPRILRDLVQPLPAIDRNRYRERPLNHMVGAYSVATAEIPVHRIIRYCRNRQSLGLLNDYSDKPQDATYGEEAERSALGMGAGPAPTEAVAERPAVARVVTSTPESPPAQDGIDLVNRVREDFGELAPEGTRKKGGKIAQAIQSWMGEVKAHIQVHVDDVLEERAIGNGHWGLREVELWEHHSEIVDPFHRDMDPVQSDSVPERFPFARPGPGGSGGVIYNTLWLNKHFKKFHVAARFLVRKHMTKHFEGVEQKAGRYTRDWLQRVRDEVDRLLNARPSGWKDARVYLDVVLSELGERVKTSQDAVGKQTFEPVSTRECYDQALGALRSLQDEVDKKPVAQRALRAGQVLGVAGGLILGAIITILAKWIPGLSPWSPGGVGWLVFPSVAALLALAWWHLRRLAQIRCDAINDIVRPKNQESEAEAVSATGGTLNRIYDDQTRRLFDVQDVRSFLGARVEWSCRLWTLRIWRRMYLALKQDLERLGDIGIALRVQTANVRDDQEGLKVRFHEEDHRFLEEVRGVFEGDSFFCQSLVTPEVLEEIYEHFSHPATRYAQEHLDSESPFAQWRDRTPFTDLNAVQNHCRGPFQELEQLDFFRFPPTRDHVQARLRDFLGDFTHKLALHADAGDGVTGELGQEEQLVLTSARNQWLVDELGPDEGWPESWEIDSRYPDPHAITLIRHVQGLAPWELPSLGSPAELVCSMISVGDHAELPYVIRTVEDVSLRLVMAGVALGELCRREAAVEEGVKPEVPELALCREILAAFSGTYQAGQNPVDGQKFVELSVARNWVRALAGEDGVLELASLLFGTSILEEHAHLGNLIERKSLLMDAGQGQVDWVWRGLMALPESWRHPVMMRLVEAEMVPHLLAQRRADEALACLDVLQPESLRASSLLRSVATLVDQGNFIHAREALQLARIPLDDDFPPMPAEYDAWIDRDGQPVMSPEELVELLVAKLSPSAELATVLVSVFGTPAHRDGGGWRGEQLTKAHPGGSVGLLNLFSGYPAGLLDAGLKAAVFSRAAATGGAS